MSNFILNAHKKCIGQFNFDPLLYYNDNGQSIYRMYLQLPGTYTITYVSGAILSFDVDKINSLLPAGTPLIDKNTFYWNRFYETSAVALGAYDLSYFPTSSILFGCFQCQFGTLPGFTKEGYKSRALAQTMNSKYYNNKDNKYSFTDKLQFTIDTPTQLVFWYNDTAEQSVQGQIVYNINYNTNDEEIYYANDISVLAINKSNQKRLSYENYAYNKNKENIINQSMKNPAQVWIQNLKINTYIKNIDQYNTIGYDKAYLQGNMKYIDTINFEQKYSQKYKWQLYKKVSSKYNFIGKFNYYSSDLLLYPGIYSMFVAHSNNQVFSQEILASGTVKQLNFSQYTAVKTNQLASQTIYTFTLKNPSIIEFSKIFKQNKTNTLLSIYLYNGVVTYESLNTYINNVEKLGTFITSPDKDLIKENYYENNYVATIENYNEHLYRYYLDISQYLENQQAFLIYTALDIKNYTSIGPFDTTKKVFDTITDVFNIPTSAITSTYISGFDNTQQWQLTYQLLIQQQQE